MAMDMLRQLAASPLPATFRTAAEIDQIKLLRAAGLVIALTPAPSESSTHSGPSDTAQVFAITEQGRQELARYALPGDMPAPHAPSSWWRSKLNAVVNLHRWM